MKTFRAAVFTGIFAMLFVTGHHSMAAVRRPETRARNVILFIGDGMGINALSAARAYSAGAGGRLQIEQLALTALARNNSQDCMVTDSAAAASAYATGFKVPSYSVNIRERGERPPLITRLAGQSGRSIGIVTTDELTGATPAAFYGYAEKRQMRELLAVQLLDSGFDVILGGEREWFSGEGGKGRDYTAEAVRKGWTVIRNARELSAAAAQSGPRVSRWLGFLAPREMGFASQHASNPDEPTLADMTLAAIRRLDRNPKGYFLVVEEGLIDKAAHQHWTRHALEEILELDRVVGIALREAGKDTLIMVVSDHETGGLTLCGNPPWNARGDDLLAPSRDRFSMMGWVTRPDASQKTEEKTSSAWTVPAVQKPASHTGTDVLIAAGGPGAEEVHGFLDNTEVFHILCRAMGLQN